MTKRYTIKFKSKDIMASWSTRGLHIWTDGSVIHGYGGCSFVFLDPNNTRSTAPMGSKTDIKQEEKEEAEEIDEFA